MRIQRVEQAITEAPEEEERGDETQREEGLAQRQLRRLGAVRDVGLEGPPAEVVRSSHGGSTGRVPLCG